MDINRQVEIMDTQLSMFPTLLEKLQYLTMFFDPDPEFSKEARDIVRAMLARAEEHRQFQSIREKVNEKS